MMKKIKKIIMIITFLRYIQQYCHKPFNLIFFNEAAIKHYLQYRQKVSKCILHIDATGSVVKVNDGTIDDLRLKALLLPIIFIKLLK
jgi:hypothetical protein